jgi:Low-density lipoprotein receptor repeat class B
MKRINETQISERNRPSTGKTIGRLFFLEASVGRILLVNADGSDRKAILSGCQIPDGVVVDLEDGHIYWTNMGVPIGTTVRSSEMSPFECLRKRKKINTSDDENHYKHSNPRTHELTHRQTQSARLL